MLQFISAFTICILIASLFPNAAMAKTAQAVVIVDKMEVRDEDGELLGTLKKGAEVTVHSTKNGIAKITYQGKKGLARLSDLEKVAQATAAPAPSTPKPTASTKATSTPKPTSSPASTPTPTGVRSTILKNGVKAYKEPLTDSKVLGTLKAGDTVQLIEIRDKWAQVTRKGETAYILKENLTSSAGETQPALPTSTATAAPASTEKTTAEKYATISQGQKGKHVMELQKKLESLGYFDGNPAGNYLSLTTQAVKLFQHEAGIAETGVADNLTQTALNSKKAPKSPILNKSFKKGDKGDDVKRIQQRLNTKGYYGGSIDGVYGENLASAVAVYQQVNGGTKTGEADSQTIRHLFSSKAADKPANIAVPVPEATPSPTPSPTPKPTQTPAAQSQAGGSASSGEPAAPSSSKAETVIAAAMAQLGKPYVYGSNGMSSFDCSGLTVYAYKTAGVSLPRTAHSQGYTSGEKITLSQLKRGDIVCFDTLSNSSLSNHVGIYLGNNQFIHASSGQKKVVISSLTGYYLQVFSWGRRVL